ncbi:RCC1 domain-containing protein [Pseudomonas sp. HK3]
MNKYLVAIVLLCLAACGSEDDSISFTRDTSNLEINVNGGKEDQLAPYLSEQYSLMAGNGRACAYGVLNALSTSYLKCWGNRIIGDYVSENITGSYKMLSIGDDHVCTTLSDFGGRRVGCAGDNEFGQTLNPDVATTVESRRGHWLQLPYVVASGDNHNCAVDSYGVYCWGDNAQGQTDVPSLNNPKWVAAGGNTSCAIDEDDSLRCWGNQSAGQGNIPETLGAVSHVAVGFDFVCAISAGQVSCWGNTGSSSWKAPDVYSEAVFISAGARHACILDQVSERTDTQSNLQADCFGDKANQADLLDVPQDVQNNIRSIAAGNGFTCTMSLYEGEAFVKQTTHKGFHCWGNNQQGQAVSPKVMCLNYHKTAVSTDDRYCPKVN